MLQVVYRPRMRAVMRELVYAVLYAAACAGLVYCCASSLWRIGDVPGAAKVLLAVLVCFGAYGAYLCGQTSVEIVQSLNTLGDAVEPEAEEDSSSEPASTASTAGTAAEMAAVAVAKSVAD